MQRHIASPLIVVLTHKRLGGLRHLSKHGPKYALRSTDSHFETMLFAHSVVPSRRTDCVAELSDERTAPNYKPPTHRRRLATPQKRPRKRFRRLLDQFPYRAPNNRQATSVPKAVARAHGRHPIITTILKDPKAVAVQRNENRLSDAERLARRGTAVRGWSQSTAISSDRSTTASEGMKRRTLLLHSGRTGTDRLVGHRSTWAGSGDRLIVD